jgi:hypothetical protein
MIHRRQLVVPFALAFIVCIAATDGSWALAQSESSFVRQHDWNVDQGEWLKIDTHVHSVLSDGSRTVEALVDAAAKNGCDAIAITDHADRDRRGASEEYFAELRIRRRQFPDMIILAGVEWNIPPHGGDEHVTVLVEPTLNEAAILAEFKDRFDDLDREPHVAELAVEALQWLKDACAKSQTMAVVIYNHPCRKRPALEPFRREFLALRAATPLLVGFEGGVGHQAGNPVGAYDGPLQLEDRWDPAAAVVGGVWDQMLQQGVDVWAALATSDFHHDRRSGGVYDYLPGKFSETWILAPDRSPRGILRALVAGSFFGEHGQFVRRVDLTLSADGLSRPAHAGEAIHVKPNASCQLALRLEIPPWDWQDVANKIDVVEFIAVDAKGARIAASFVDVTTDKVMDLQITVPDGGMVVRARGRRHIFQRPDYVFMTNPIRVLTHVDNVAATAVRP